MIADLPAKRHRVMVNPSNPILRPRKKLDQQRSKLILKRRPPEMSKTRKQQDDRNVKNRARLVATIEDNDDKSSKDDDDKPLKPRIKRLLTKNSRQKESLKRKVVLNRAKRRAQLKEQMTVPETEESENKPNENQSTEPADTTVCSRTASIEQLSIGGTSQKIDLNNSPYQTREHSGRGRSNNNDQHRPGSSEQNGNINNAFAPTSNEPLKHSIARLTADTDIYDKSLHFHHQMFLLQQECNSINQHVPVGQQRLFENEAVVTKLDKPPLHFQRGMLDPFAFQRNKLNRPRKGLNDCIAMLKNKLVEPILTNQSTQSVESGSDDSLMCQSATTNRRVPDAEYQLQVNTRPAEIFSRHHFIQDRLIQLRNESNLMHQSFTDIPLHFLSAQNMYEIPRRGNKIEKVKVSKQKQLPGPKRESTRRRSTRSEKDNVRNKKYVLPPHIELIQQKSNENYSAKVSPLSKFDSVLFQNIENNSRRDSSKRKQNQSCMPTALHQRKQRDTICSALEIKSHCISNDAQLYENRHTGASKHHSKHVEIRERSPIKQVESCIQSKQVDIYVQPQLKQTDTCPQFQMKKADDFTQSQLKQSDTCPQSHMKKADAFTQSQLKQIDTCSHSQMKKADAFTQSQLKPIDPFTTSQLKQTNILMPSQLKQAEVFTPSQLQQVEAYLPSQIKQADVYIKPQVNSTESYLQTQIPNQKPSAAYTECNFNKMTPETFPECEVPRIIITTHELYPESNFDSMGVTLTATTSGSNNLDLVLPVPLDLSVTINDNTETSKQNSSYELNDYDSYETLDLSSKSVEEPIDDINDGIVDLRVKSCDKSQKDLGLATKNDDIDIEIATDLTIKTLEMDNIPTDLTVKKKIVAYEYDYSCVQDLSKHDFNTCETSAKILPIAENDIVQDIPTDLSGKKGLEHCLNIKDIPNVPDNPKDIPCTDEDLSNTCPANLSSNKDLGNQINQENFVEEEVVITAENSESEIDVEKSQDSYDVNEVQSYIINRQEPFINKDSYACVSNDSTCLLNKRLDDPEVDTKILYNQSSTVTTADQVLSYESVQTLNSQDSSASINLKNLTKPQTDYSSMDKPKNNLICLSDNAIPLYTMSNTTLISTSKHESTMPVYTLANACISMSKIEPTRRAPKVEPIKFPESIDTSSEVCTQAGSIRLEDYSAIKLQNAMSKFENLSESQTSAINCSEARMETQTTISHIISTSVSFTTPSVEVMKTVDDNSPKISDVDTETAKKIAMLPKELVEILGTMPIDHRNQLLNILPQYVSKSPPVIQSKESSMGSSTLCTVMETSTLTCQSNVLSHLTGVEQTCQDEIKPITRFHAMNETPTIGFDTYNPIASKTPEIDQNRIIDLTEDDPTFESKPKKLIEEYKSSVTITIDPPLPKLNKTKVNDQTASLRAVRIKTASERNKSICIENQILKTNVEQQIKINVQNFQNLQSITERPLEIDKTMAIQQAEVSSTQHNTTSKYPLAISPASTESSSDEAGKNISQKNIITVVGTVPENIQDKMYNASLPKSSKVSSSISNKVINETNVVPLVNKDAKDASSVISPIHHIEPIQISTNKVNISLGEPVIASVVSEPAECIPKQDLSPLDPDDSEDDVSLAVIVKQKQQDQNKKEDVLEELNREIDNKKKKYKRTKKSKQKTAHKTSDITSDKNVNYEVNKTIPINNEINKVPLLATNQNTNIVMEKPLKKYIDEVKLDPNSQITISDDKCYQNFLSFSEKNTHNNEKNEVTFDPKNNETTIDAASSEICQAHTKDEIHKNIIENIDEVSLKPHKKKCKSKTNLNADVLLNGIDNNLSQSADIDKNEKGGSIEQNLKADTLVNLTASCLQAVEDISNIKRDGKAFDYVTPLSTTSISDVTDGDSGQPQGVTHNISSEVLEANDKKTSSGKKNKTVDIDINDKDITDDKDTIMNIAIPLRRSRRGKSLFMENTSLEKEITNTSETTTENKAPLTKKQLIFSKLLLDEGKPEKFFSDKLDQYKKEDLLKNVSEQVYKEISSKPQTDSHNDVFERNKASKRTISPHSSRKSKKQKSLDNCESNFNDCSKTQIKNPLVDSLPNTNNSTEEKSLSLIDFKENDNLVPHVSNEVDTSLEVNVYHKYNEKPTVSPEKRKINNELAFEVSGSSKPKKCKTTKREKLDNNMMIEVDDHIKNKDVKTSESNDSCASGPRTTCYNISAPARRGRSKSVVVKSSGADLYDPYDIDLEDMIEQHESFRRKKKSLDHKSDISQKKSKTSERIAIDENESTTIEKNVTVKGKSAMSDSDESSKSDIPLQKYVEEKEKKSIDTEVFSTQKSNYEISESLKETKSLKQCSSDTITLAENEAEEKLRSDQFMESFGFFSERKPRKSNLLATKKISETFHINNESDDMYFGFKGRSSKKSLQIDKDTKKSFDNEGSKLTQPSTSKKAAKRGRKRKSCTKILPSYCGVCKKEFRRPDNFLRHQITLLHISKLSEVELKVKTSPVQEEPNYLIAYKQYLERFKKLTDKISKLKRKNPKAAAKIVLPSMQEILSDVNRAVREQQLSQRGLSHDEELFIDCCELLKESHNGDKVNTTNDVKSSMSGLDLLENVINASFSNTFESDDDDVDSITAQNILESEEVRNLENDLISGLKEAANASRKSCNNHCQNSNLKTGSDNPNDKISSPNETGDHYQMTDFDMPEKQRSSRAKKHSICTELIPVKEKMYPDVIEDIDMFEDKFDKIKRKCRSQAAAAKQTPPVVKITTSHKSRRKSEKKKGKRSSKKTRHQSTQVPTKGALKGFDGIKVSIPTSDINLPSLVPAVEKDRKKKKNSSKKRRDKKDSESSGKYDSDHRGKDSAISHNKKLDVYEFMDNEDAELFEFRPSTLMERFKSISNKETPSTSKLTSVVKDNSSESGSDGDDFVYMSDDYVCSDDETENSLLSCENGNAKLGNDAKKNVSPQKRKDVVEKNAVMGKIFKHNAVRSEKKITVPKDPVKPKANLDQLFDSLLEEEPSTSMLNSELDSPRKDNKQLPLKKHTLTSSTYHSDLDFNMSDDEKTYDSHSPDRPKFVTASTSKSIEEFQELDTHHKSSLEAVPLESCASPSFIDYGPSTSKKYDKQLQKEYKNISPKSYDSVSLKKNEEMSHKHCDTMISKHSEASTSKQDEIFKPFDDFKSKSSAKKLDRCVSSSFDYGEDIYDASVFDESGVARQRARRKCTVGKQNILAESWSSESEPDGGPQRPNSAESVVAGSGRKKKGKKKDGQQNTGKRGNNRQMTFKRYDVGSRVNSSNRNTSSGGSTVGPSTSTVDDGITPGPSGLGSKASVPSTSAAAAEAEAAAAAAMPAPSTSQAPTASGQKGRQRSVAYYWSSEGDDEQEHQQQHGWIVGDSHKKLVTMLAHAKGRKRNNDDKRNLVE
ncbi:unnamed protein product [Diatraea saccharalis]|nr:unnamed protein product [Diatraea saccharalis]